MGIILVHDFFSPVATISSFRDVNQKNCLERGKINTNPTTQLWFSTLSPPRWMLLNLKIVGDYKNGRFQIMCSLAQRLGYFLSLIAFSLSLLFC